MSVIYKSIYANLNVLYVDIRNCFVILYTYNFIGFLTLRKGIPLRRVICFKLQLLYIRVVGVLILLGLKLFFIRVGVIQRNVGETPQWKAILNLYLI